MDIFISRDLAADSPLWQIQTAYPQLQIRAESLISLSPLAFELSADCDFLFFYSRNGVRFFFAQVAEGQTLPRLAALGQGTAEELLKYTQKVDFVGTGKPAETAEAFLNLAKNKKICFVRGRESVESVRKIIENQIIALDLCVYDNLPKRPDFAPTAKGLLLTSPMNVRAYFEAFLAENIAERIDFVVVIGHTTAEALKPYYAGRIYIAQTPSELGLYSTLREAIKNCAK